MKNVSVEIMGQSLVVSSDADDNWVKSVAEAVDARIKDIRANGRSVNSVNVAILAALNFADELPRLKKEHQELIDRIEALSDKLSISVGDR
jgi:cell division protein ZapA